VPKVVSRRFAIPKPDAIVTVRLKAADATEEDIRQALQRALAEQEERLRGGDEQYATSHNTGRKASKV
jgi:hypothetical protein